MAAPKGAALREDSCGEILFCDDGRRRVAAGTFYPSSRTFLKKVHSKHLLRKPHAICIQEHVLRMLAARGCLMVRVQLLDEGRTIEAPFELFAKHGVRVVRGYGRQKALPMGFWINPGVLTARPVRVAQSGLNDEGGVV